MRRTGARGRAHHVLMATAGVAKLVAAGAVGILRLARRSKDRPIP